MVKQLRITTKNKIRQLMILHATNSPTKLSRIMTHEGHRITRQSVDRHMQDIRAETQEYCYALAKDVYTETAEDEHLQLNKLIVHTYKAILECKPGTQMAMLVNAYTTLTQRRQYVMEDMVMDSSDGKWVQTYYPKENEAEQQCAA